MVSARLVRRYLAITWRGYALLPRALALIAWLFLRQRAPHRRAVALLRRALAAPRVGGDPLLPLEAGLYQVAPWFLRGADGANALEPGELEPDALTVLHLLGTGEHRYSPLVGLAGQCRAEPRLCALRHVVVDSSYEGAAYLGPHEFGTRLRRTLAPLLARHRDRVVFSGLSRGATAALDIGSELAEVHGTRVGVLALSPPFVRPRRPPHTVVNIGGFEPVTENFVHQLELNPWLRPFGHWLLRFLYVRFTGYVLAELRLASEPTAELFARFLAGIDPRDACRRAVREFALLQRVSDAELRHVVSGVTQRLARTAAARAIVCFAEQDAWIEIVPCEARLRSLIERDDVPASRLRAVTLPGLNHGVAREPDQDFSAVAGLLWEVCEHASRPAASQPDPVAMLAEGTV